jgi:hypothetical protein
VEQPFVVVDDIVGRANVEQVAADEQGRPVAERADRVGIVRDEDDRRPALLEELQLPEALLLEVGVADGQHLVDHEDLGVHVDRDPEAEPCVHPG